MSKLVRDYLEIRDFMSLDALIERLQEVRSALSEPEQAEVRMRGDDVFGRHLSISFMRPQTEEEEACEARYAEAYRESRERELSRLQDELGICAVPQASRKLRIVA